MYALFNMKYKYKKYGYKIITMLLVINFFNA